MQRMRVLCNYNMSRENPLSAK